MTSPRDSRVLAAYSDQGPRVRFHTWYRWRTCPFDRLERLIPRAGSVLDLGCGHGLLTLHLALSAPDRQVTGTDIDPDKLVVAAAAARAAGVDGRVVLHRSEDTGSVPGIEGGWDAIVCNDVLYLLGVDEATALVRNMAEALAPVGVVVLKEMADRPRWKAAVNHVQETLAVRALGITEGDRVDVVPVGMLVSALQESGCTVSVHDIAKGYPHAHVAVVGTVRDANSNAGVPTTGFWRTDRSDPDRLPRRNPSVPPDRHR